MLCEAAIDGTILTNQKQVEKKELNEKLDNDPTQQLYQILSVIGLKGNNVV